MPDKSLGSLTAVASAADEDHLLGSQGGNSRRFTVGQVRAGLALVSHNHAIGDTTGLQAALDGKAATSHNHAIGDVTGLQAALDGKAPTSHNHAIGDTTGLQAALDGKAATSHNHDAAAITTGVVAPARLGTGTDITTKFLRGDGTWQTVAGGAVAYGDLTGIPAAIDAIDGLTPAADRVAYYTGASTAALATLTGFARTLLDDADAATARATLGITDGPSLAANQFTARNNANDGFEARTEKVVGSVFLPITGNVAGGAAEGQIGMWGNKPCTLTAVRARTLSGTCSTQIRKNGTAINGFGSAVGQTTSVTNTASTEALTQDDILDVVVTSASSLTGLFITFLGTRTGN